uniref:Uncharacterized protein n=1 Tax=Glossina pallidipes TaxID=7398 RepID=A0A1A9ZI16_GLOPL
MTLRGMIHCLICLLSMGRDCTGNSSRTVASWSPSIESWELFDLSSFIDRSTCISSSSKVECECKVKNKTYSQKARVFISLLALDTKDYNIVMLRVQQLHGIQNIAPGTYVAHSARRTHELI